MDYTVVLAWVEICQDFGSTNIGQKKVAWEGVEEVKEPLGKIVVVVDYPTL